MSTSTLLTAPAVSHEPAEWLASTPLLDLEDAKLRLRAQQITQACRTERDRIVALHVWVRRIRFAMPFKMRLHTAREVMDQGCGDPSDKATLLVAALRSLRIPARLRFVTLKAETLRGLLSNPPDPMHPIVEVFHDGRWRRTDTYIHDEPYLAAARQRLQALGWTRGLGVVLEGHDHWDAGDDVFVGGAAPEVDPMLLLDHGWYCDPLEFVSSPAYRETHTRMERALQWHVLSPAMDHAIRALRREALGLSQA